jgi:hypothetical protein
MVGYRQRDLRAEGFGRRCDFVAARRSARILVPARRGARGQFDPKAKDAGMPNDSKPDQPQMPENPLRSLITLALPWLSFQREVLEIAKKNIQDADTVKPVQRFTFSELHALMMVLDPSHTHRNRFDEDFEKKVEEAYKEIVPKLTTASVQLIEAQQKALTVLFEGLNGMRKGEKGEKGEKGDKRPKSEY